MAETKVLIVAGEDIVARDLQNKLKGLGYGVSAVTASGEPAIKTKVAAIQPDLALVDVTLKRDTDGTEVAKRIRADFDVPVVLFTASADEKPLQRATLNGPCGCLVRPSEESGLQSAIEMALYKHRMETELKRKERSFRALIENASDISLILNGDRTLRYGSPAIGRLLGYQAEDYVGKDILELVHPDDVAKIDQAFTQTSLKPGSAIFTEVRIRHRDGSWRIFEAISNNLLDDPAVAGIIVNARDITERVQAEEEVRKQRDFAEGLIETAQAIVLVLDLEGRIVRFNSYLEEISGYPLREVQGQDWFSTFLPERDRARIREMFLEAMGDTRTRGIVNSIVTKDGCRRQIEWYDTLMKDRNGDLIGLLAIGQDVTERMRAEEEIRQRNRELALLNRVITAATSTLDVERVLQIVCRELADTFGLPQAAAGLLNAEGTEVTVVAEHLAPGRPSALGETITIMGNPATEYVLRHQAPLAVTDTQRDERVASIHELLRAFNMQSLLTVPVMVRGRIVGAIGLGATERRQFSTDEITLAQNVAAAASQVLEIAQLYQALQDNVEQLEETVAERTAEVQAQYARLEAILSSTADGMIVTDGQGAIVQLNPVARTWLTQTLSPQDANRLRAMIREQVQRVGDRPECVLELNGLDLQLKAAPILEPRVTGAEAVVAVHDVSHLKEVDRIKSRFITNVSHELRTPITSFKLYLGLMRRSPEKWEQYLDVLDQEADRQVRLIENILQISRIDAGRLEITPQPTPLNALIEEAVTNNELQARNRGLTLTRRLTKPATLVNGPSANSTGSREVEPPVALVDPDTMVQVVNNLVSNAIRYTPEGGQIEISTGLGKANGRRWATITVADTGLGIPQEELPHIFERFYRGERAQNMHAQGTGLGLAIVKEIVELHNGRVTVDSQVGMGTTFTVYLPLADQYALSVWAPSAFSTREGV